MFLDQELISYRYSIIFLLFLFFFFLLLLGSPLQKSRRLRRFNSTRDAVRPDCSSSTHR